MKTIHPLLSHYSSMNRGRGGEGRGRLFKILADRWGAYLKGVLIRGGGGTNSRIYSLLLFIYIFCLFSALRDCKRTQVDKSSAVDRNSIAEQSS